ncbi:unnamed protein product [Laminaria digitata]
MRATLESGTSRSSRGSGGGAGVNMDTAVAQRLMDTYARMAGDADSYVYLAAVQGLAALADALPGWCIPRLVALFVASASATTTATTTASATATTAATATATATANDTASATTTANTVGSMARAVAAQPPPPLPLSQRLKIGEAVVLSARRCGEAMPKYSRFYINAFVAAARERSDGEGGAGGAGTSASPGGIPPKGGTESSSKSASSSMLDGGDGGGKGAEAAGAVGGDCSLESRERYHFRASCLSNLAEVCQLLRWSLGRSSQDVVGLGVGILSMETGSSEEAVLARRGAAFLLGRLLKGAGEDVLQIVPAADLRSAYRAVKRTAEHDADEATRSHAANGLSYLDVVIRGQLFPAGGGSGGSGGGGGGGVNGIGGTGEQGRGANGEEASSTSAHHPGITVL